VESFVEHAVVPYQTLGGVDQTAPAQIALSLQSTRPAEVGEGVSAGPGKELAAVQDEGVGDQSGETSGEGGLSKDSERAEKDDAETGRINGGDGVGGGGTT